MGQAKSANTARRLRLHCVCALRRKDWYFRGTKAQAEARRIGEEWAFLVQSWAKLRQPKLEIRGVAFAAEPHWQIGPSMHGASEQAHAASGVRRDDGLPLYRVRENGTHYDKVGKWFGAAVYAVWA